jgi:hypothetical protein
MRAIMRTWSLLGGAPPNGEPGPDCAPRRCIHHSPDNGMTIQVQSNWSG